ncbi:HlyC/CorC family transporter [Acanthopleuribacter pedis]|uniref:HlyC/CorC family transporter n=1 Tax=Acanthopleuribacter pedis TaxID=442870 RepID=A0A8J7QLX5_9BACT|nr:hemolysin family protein [Acanthopleuribacter pedis]MBO1320753.1 HlyC/CorC family transporter [Acanthopleuribacter pedis]
MVTLVVAVAVVLIASALCSGSEAALFSIPINKVRQLAQSKSRNAVALLKVQENMARPIAAIVILNNIANIVGSSVVTAIAFDLWGDLGRSIISGVLTFLVILLSEIIPKTLGERYCNPIALYVARPVLFLAWLFLPLMVLLEFCTSWLSEGNSAVQSTNEAEIRYMAKLGQREGVIEKDESEMIQRVFEMNDRTAAELMTPRTKITYLLRSKKLNEVLDEVLQSPHSRILVAESVPDDIKSMVFKNELLAAALEGRGEEPLENFEYNVRFVPAGMPADRLLTLFRNSRQHLAVVLDEYSGVNGVVTLEDVLEVLTGEIVDETDLEPDLQAAARADWHLRGQVVPMKEVPVENAPTASDVKASHDEPVAADENASQNEPAASDEKASQTGPAASDEKAPQNEPSGS